LYCIYLRKSRADLELEAKGELETLARHRATLLEYAKKHGLAIGAIYEEIVSGETIEARPVVQRLLKEVEQGAWEGVLVMEIERLARGDTIDQGFVARAFQIGKAKIVTPIKTYDPENEFDEEYFEFGLFMSRREYKTINRRIQRGRIASAKEGKYLGAEPPYGYDKVRIKGDKGYTLSPNEQEAPAVRYIFERYISGAGMPTIARELDAMGIKPRHGAIWNKETIGDILENPVYIGKIRWSYKAEKKYVKDGKVLKRRTVNDNPIYVDGLHPPLVSEEQFKLAAKIREQNRLRSFGKKTPGRTLQNPLSGLIYCAECGQLMKRMAPCSRNPYASIRCLNPYCKNVAAPLYLVESKLIETVSAWLQNIQLKMPEENTLQSETEALRQALRTAENELEKLQAQLARTYDLLEQGIYTTELFLTRNKELSERISASQAKIEEIKKQLDEMGCNEKLTEQLPKMINALNAYSEATTAEEKNLLLKQIIARVEYRKTTQNHRGQRDNANFELHIFPRIAGQSRIDA